MSDACDDRFRDLLAEAALGVLDEPERSAVLTHAETCASCGPALADLVAVSDRLVALAPQAEPPPGFEQRVLARVSAARRPRGRRWLVAVAAVLLLVAGMGVGALVTRDDDGLEGADAAELETPSGTAVGSVVVAGDRLRAVVMRLDRYPEGVAYACQLVLADGTVVDVGTWEPGGGHDPAWWAATVDAPGEVVEARMLDPDGTLWARADLT